jgi:hypothetical protein
MLRCTIHQIRYVICGLIVAAVVSACSVDPELRAARASLPRTIAGLDWPALLPLGAFNRAQSAPLPADTASLAARAASLRARSAAAFANPVISPARRDVLRAALARNGY